MYLGFKKSRAAMIAIIVFSVILCVLVWIRDRELEVYIPILASAFLLAIGYLTGRLVANLVATSETTRALGLLHMELDPQAFIDKYKSVPDRVPEKSRDRIIAGFYLADGYDALGDFTAALDALRRPSDDRKNDDALMGTYYSSLIRSELGLSDFENAEKHLALLDRLTIQTPKKDLTAHLRANHNLYSALLAVMKGEVIDTAALKKAFEKTEYEMRRLELLNVFALNDKNRGAVNSEKESLNLLAEHGGKTRYAEAARKRLESLN